MTEDAFEKAVLGDTKKYSVKATYLPIVKAKFPHLPLDVASDSSVLA